MLNLYIANLGKYVEGYLVGEWISLPFTQKELEDLFVRIKLGFYDKFGKYIHGLEEDGSFYEEYAIHDYEKDIPIEIGEYSNIEELNKIAEELEALSEHDKDLVVALTENYGYNFEEAVDKMDDVSYIQLNQNTLIDDETNLAYEVIDQIYGDVSELPREMLERYFDYSAFGRDLGYDYTIASNGIATNNY